MMILKKRRLCTKIIDINFKKDNNFSLNQKMDLVYR